MIVNLLDLPFDTLLKFVSHIPKSDDMRTWCCLARFAKTCRTANELVKAVVEHPETSDIAPPPKRTFHAVYVKACPQVQGKPTNSATLDVGFKDFKPYATLSVVTNDRRIEMDLDPLDKSDKERGALNRLERPAGWHRIEKQYRDPFASPWFESGDDRSPYKLRGRARIYYLDSNGNDGLQQNVLWTKDQRAVVAMELSDGNFQSL